MIAAGVGGKKKAEIEKKAGELKLRVINSTVKKVPTAGSKSKVAKAGSEKNTEAKLSSPKKVKVEKPAVKPEVAETKTAVSPKQGE
jgi:ribosomal protein L32E